MERQATFGQDCVYENRRLCFSLGNQYPYANISSGEMPRTRLCDECGIHIVRNSGDLKWETAPPTLPKGADIAVLSGDPSKEGLFVLRLRMPSGYKISAHNHPTDEGATVITGNFHIGMGDKLDETKAIELTAGGYAEAPAKMNHYGWTSSPSVVQIHGQGPFGNYVNPADDPSKK
ncbi:quercetin dioxygenase-like cupin family protein [Bradyrhizobium diazoefficiens]